jgi:Haem-NO-binding
MKGVVFTEFLDMVEEKFSADMVDDIIEMSNLASGGAYTAVGTYPHEELVAMVVALSKQSGVATGALINVFGQHLFKRFYVRYPHFFANVPTAFDFLSGIEDVIHVEVLKLYPDAQLPRFVVEKRSADELVLVYHSARHFGDLAAGLMQGCVAHFGENINIARQDLKTEDGNANIQFTLQIQA